MNKEDIMRMAWKAGFERLGHTDNDWVCYPEDIERFAALVIKPWADQLEVERKKFQELNDIAVVGMQHARIAERNRILAICKEGLWDAEGIRYHLDNQDKGQA